MEHSSGLLQLEHCSAQQVVLRLTVHAIMSQLRSCMSFLPGAVNQKINIRVKGHERLFLTEGGLIMINSQAFRLRIPPLEAFDFYLWARLGIRDWTGMANIMGENGARFQVEEGLTSPSSSGCVIALSTCSVALIAIEVSREFTRSTYLLVWCCRAM